MTMSFSEKKISKNKIKMEEGSMGNFSELDMYLFGQATHYDIYKKLGAHPQVRRKK